MEAVRLTRLRLCDQISVFVWLHPRLRWTPDSLALNYTKLQHISIGQRCTLRLCVCVCQWRRSRMCTSVSLMLINVKCTFNCLCMYINVFSLVMDTVYVLFCAWEIQCGRIRRRAEHSIANTSIYKPYSVSRRVTN